MTTLKKLLTFYLLIATNNFCISQTKKADFSMQIGCGYAGQTDKEFYEYARYIKDKEYETLKKNLNSQKLIDQLLSTIALDELLLQGKVSLTDNEKETVLKIKSLKKKYYLCNGCTGHHHEKINDLFKHNQADKSLANHLKLIKSKLGFKVDW